MYRKFPHFFLATEGSKGAASPQSFPGEMTHWLCGFQRLFNSIFVRFQNRRARVSVGGQLRSLFPCFPGERFNSLTTHSLSCLNFIQPMKAIRNQDGTAQVLTCYVFFFFSLHEYDTLRCPKVWERRGCLLD